MNWLQTLREWWRANVPPLPKWQGWVIDDPPKPLPGDEESNLWP